MGLRARIATLFPGLAGFDVGFLECYVGLQGLVLVLETDLHVWLAKLAPTIQR